MATIENDDEKRIFDAVASGDPESHTGWQDVMVRGGPGRVDFMINRLVGRGLITRDRELTPLGKLFADQPAAAEAAADVEPAAPADDQADDQAAAEDSSDSRSRRRRSK